MKKLNTLKRMVVFLFFLLPLTGCWGTDFLALGEKALNDNDWGKAQTYLEAALSQGAVTEKLSLDLGLVYQKLGLFNEAKKVFKKGADLEGPQEYLILYNLGLVDFALKDYSGADDCYSQALALRPDMSEGHLNRANVRLELKNWVGAVEDFKTYQTMAPTNPQKEKIDQVLALLEQTKADEEAQKLAASVKKQREEDAKKASEEAKAKEAADIAAAEEEKAKLAAAQAAEEKKKQDEILAKIRGTLDDSSGDTKTLKTGPSGVKTEDGDFVLE